MKRPLPLALLIIVCVIITGCGSDRTAAARDTVQNYWYDIGHGKVKDAYSLLTPGTQQGLKLDTYTQTVFGFLQQTAGVKATVGHVDVVGDCAQVALALDSPKAPGGTLHAYQHLYWLDGSWKISDANGQLSQSHPKLTCPTGT